MAKRIFLVILILALVAGASVGGYFIYQSIANNDDDNTTVVIPPPLDNEGNGESGGSGGNQQIVKTKLEAPSNFKIERNILWWKSVQNAKNYVVEITKDNNVVATKEVSINSIDLLQSFVIDLTNCNVVVKAIATNLEAFENSESVSNKLLKVNFYDRTVLKYAPSVLLSQTSASKVITYSDYKLSKEFLYVLENGKVDLMPEKFVDLPSDQELTNFQENCKVAITTNVNYLYEADMRHWYYDKTVQEIGVYPSEKAVVGGSVVPRDKFVDGVASLYVRCYTLANTYNYKQLQDKTLSMNKRDNFTFLRKAEIPIQALCGTIVTKIGDYCFDAKGGYNILNLISTIGQYNLLEDIFIPETITEIGKYSFRQNFSMKNITIPNTVNLIDDYAFEACYAARSNNSSCGLETISINGTPKIGQSIFRGCTKISEFNYDSKGEAYSLPQGFLAHTTTGIREKHLQIFLSDGIEEIPANAFSYSKIKSIRLPSAIKSIGANAFLETEWEQEKLILPQVETIYENAFSKVSGLIEVVAPNVLTVADKAFYSCPNLQIVDFQNVKYFGLNSFSDCCLLNKVVINVAVETICQEAFKNCSKFKFFNVDGVEFSQNDIQSLKDNPNVDNSAFLFTQYDPNYNVSVDEGNGIEVFDVLKKGAPSYKTIVGVKDGLPDFDKSTIETIYIPKEIQRIDGSAFNDCPMLKKIIFKQGSQFKAFNYNYDITSSQRINEVCYIDETAKEVFGFPNSLTEMNFREFGAKIDFTKESETIKTTEFIPFYKKLIDDFIKTVDVSAQQEYQKFLIYGDGILLYVYSNMSSIVIPKEVKSIVNGAFVNIENSFKVSFEEGTVISHLSDFAFYSQPNAVVKISSIIIPKTVEIIGKNALYRCTELDYIEFEDKSSLWYVDDFGISFLSNDGAEVKVYHEQGAAAFSGTIQYGDSMFHCVYPNFVTEKVIS